MADVTDLYLQAQALRAAGERVVSTDEMTGIQALERKHPTIPMGPGRAERRGVEYIRRGTLTLIADIDRHFRRGPGPHRDAFSGGPTGRKGLFCAHYPPAGLR